MEETRGHRELVVWQRAMDLVVAVYESTAAFPKEEIYGLVSQMRRSSVSVPSNIAEGHGVGGGGYGRHLDIAYGSLMELQTQIELSRRLSFIGSEDLSKLMELVSSVIKPLVGLRKAVQSKGS